MGWGLKTNPLLLSGSRQNHLSQASSWNPNRLRSGSILNLGLQSGARENDSGAKLKGRVNPDSYFRSPSLPMTDRYRSRSVCRRYFNCSVRWLTSLRSPRRLEKSFLWARMCSVSSLIRAVSSAICTSGEPLSCSARRNWLISSAFRSFVIAIFPSPQILSVALLPSVYETTSVTRTLQYLCNLPPPDQMARGQKVGEG